MAHEVSCRLLTKTEAQVRARNSPCGIFGRESGTKAGFRPSCLGFSCQYHSIVGMHTLMSSGRWTIDKVEAAAQRHCLTLST
jgi:hypothetical protein